MDFEATLNYARSLDQEDPLKKFQSEFHIPQKNGSPVRYFTGNSLGLQPKSAKKYIEEELESWKNLAVDAHFEGIRPWFHYHKFSKEGLCKLTGSKPVEVVAFGNLSTNLHLLLVSFYQPTTNKHKILMEAGAFPSDQYIVETQVKFHGFDPNDSIIELKPRAGNDTLETSDILDSIEQNKDEIALVLLSGVQYYTGQFFDIPSISKHCKKFSIPFGLDLAHAIGNVPLNLHDDEVDFAVWCSYKYLNSGAGNTSGIFVHERHASSNIRRFGGWWGHNEDSRFLMEKGFKPMDGADGWQLSNVNVISTSVFLASLDIFDRAGIENLRKKSIKLTGFLYFLISSIQKIRSITPDSPNERGCQLSLVIESGIGKQIFNSLMNDGLVVDWREPDVIRIAPVPLYNSFEDVFILSEALKDNL